MADKGPLLTSCIIFYLSVGAAVFQILEEPNWKSAKDQYIQQKNTILKKYTCLTKEGLDEILQIVSEAAGQGVTITGDRHRNTWDWSNSVIFAATIVTTIGYGNVAPKTQGGRIFCILYGLCGIPLCLVWISELGSFFGDRAKRLSGVLIRRRVSVKKVQFTCTALFLLWGLLVHLLIPPLVFMSVEEWSYLEGLYFSFITLTTVGFGDYVAGVNPNIEYPRLYRVFAELWIYMGLAWLSLFFSWNVHMVVEAHKVLKKRRHRYRHLHNEEPQPIEAKHRPEEKPTVVDIFNFLSETQDDYSTVIKKIGITAKLRRPAEDINRSRSCSDLLDIQTLEQSPKHKRRVSFGTLPISTEPDVDEGDEEERRPVCEGGRRASVPAGGLRRAKESAGGGAFDPEAGGVSFPVPPKAAAKEEHAQRPGSGGSRFTIRKVSEDDALKDKNG
ncbi:potassium channel subfamily K member 5-like [Betta splendens]|uniref:Potassium channel subfamily K member 5-like n=1 Tax=Betta splendens TaxID=158456 RepID=A0A6P7KMX2_BETSP|nr:potassium channel subfamily K member 5-like [Betta splendens]